MSDYEHNIGMVGGIEDSSPPQAPQRKCKWCPAKLRHSNGGDLCACCQRKMDLVVNRERTKRMEPNSRTVPSGRLDVPERTR